ncbi:MAG: ParB/RepB/Spo0J family partition protein [Alphaproteobacteria bacterium]|nr:ParB/RepB/Spo0J family partition protein [Alphaproteobacteria bacterium]
MSTQTARKGLGRGLSALIPSDILDASTGADRKGALRMIRLDRITPNPEQPRIVFRTSALEELAESIREHGVLTPLLVRRDDRDGYILVAGERRLRASGLAGLEEVPCWVRDDVGSREQLELALVENIQREDLDPIETAESYRRLCEDFGMTQEQVARRVGKDRATVANAIRLLRLPSFALAELRAGAISAGHAKALLSLPDDDLIRTVLREVIAQDLSVRATERRVKAIMAPRRKKKRTAAPTYPHLQEKLTRSLGTKVKVEARASGNRGRIVLEWFSPDELDRLAVLLTDAAVGA